MKKQIHIQMDLFDGPKSENEFLWQALSQLKDSQDKVRKKVFKELNELKKLLNSAHELNLKFIQFLGEEELKTESISEVMV